MISGLPLGLALASGVNTYLPLLLVALFARFSGLVHLSPRFAWLVSDQAIFILGLLAVCEILAQKFPVLDNLWDFLHTLVRPIAGGIAAGATLNTDEAFQFVLMMIMGGTLAAAAHSAKSSVRLISTSKSFGSANIVLSLGEDVAVVTGTLLSIYAPLVMLGIVLLFVVIFAFFGPRLLRTLSMNLRVAASWLAWLWRWARRAPAPRSLKESLLEPAPEKLQALSRELDPGEELLGALPGWRRSRGGPHTAWLLLTTQRLLLVESRLLRKPKVERIPYGDLSVVRSRNLGILSRVELLTRQNESVSVTFRRTHGHFATMALERIQALARLGEEAGQSGTGVAPAAVSNPR